MSAREAGSGGTASGPAPRGALRWLLRAPIVLYRLRLGALLGRRFLLLEHTGRNSGVVRATVLEVVRLEPATGRCVVASGWGERAQWLRNVTVEPRVRYTIGTRERDGQARRTTAGEGERELRDYGRRHPRALGKLARMMLGRAFDGSDEAYAALSRQVPVVELSPAGADRIG